MAACPGTRAAALTGHPYWWRGPRTLQAHVQQFIGCCRYALKAIFCWFDCTQTVDTFPGAPPRLHFGDARRSSSRLCCVGILLHGVRTRPARTSCGCPLGVNWPRGIAKFPGAPKFTWRTAVGTTMDLRPWHSCLTATRTSGRHKQSSARPIRTSALPLAA